jgi:hypothetical protein
MKQSRLKNTYINRIIRKLSRQKINAYISPSFYSTKNIYKVRLPMRTLSHYSFTSTFSFILFLSWVNKIHWVIASIENIEGNNYSIPTSVMESSNGECEHKTPTSATNLCIACMTDKRAVVFVPCGHYIACLPCGHGMAICPMCRSKITACLRIYE